MACLPWRSGQSENTAPQRCTTTLGLRLRKLAKHRPSAAQTIQTQNALPLHKVCGKTARRNRAGLVQRSIRSRLRATYPYSLGVQLPSVFVVHKECLWRGVHIAMLIDRFRGKRTTAAARFAPLASLFRPQGSNTRNIVEAQLLEPLMSAHFAIHQFLPKQALSRNISNLIAMKRTCDNGWKNSGRNKKPQRVLL
jgi:hypothetical protein